MSTRDKLYGILDTLTDEQLEGLFQFLSHFVSTKKNNEKNKDELDELMGVFHDAADPSKRYLEKTAWETNSVDKYLHSMGEM